MATLGSLIISLEANTAKFEAGMNKAQYTAKKTSDAIKGTFVALGAALAGALSVSAFEGMVKSVASMESAMLKMAGRLNTNVETLSSFGVMIRKTGMDTDSFYMALTRLEKGMSAAGMKAEEATGKFDEEGEEIMKSSGAYEQLGLNVGVLLKLPLAQQLMAIAEAFKNNIAPADRVNIAMQLFGKSGAGMVNILKGGAEDIQKWITEQENLGTITTENAKKSAEFTSAVAGLTAAWQNFKREIAEGVIPGLVALIEKLNQAISTSRRMSEESATYAAKFPGVQAHKLGTGAVSGMGPFGEAGGEPGAVSPMPYRAPEGLNKPPVRPGDILKGGGGGGKGGGGGGGLDRMASIIDTLQKDLSRLTEGSLAEIREWANKTRNEIEKVGQKGADTERALTLTAEVESAKKKKATEDYELFVARESGDAYKQIEANAQDWLNRYKGFADAEKNIAIIKNKKIADEQSKQESDRLGLQKSFLESIASEMPFITQQLELKQKILPIESEINKLELERKLTSMQISEAQKDELRGLMALSNQAKKLNLEREKLSTQGVGGGMQLWAQGKKQEGETAGATQTVAAMKKLESGISSTISQGIVGALTGAKPDFEQIGLGIATMFIQATIEMAVSKLFATLAAGFLEGALVTVPVEATAATTAAGIKEVAALSTAAIETAAATTSGAILVTAATTMASEIVGAATTAAAILASAKAASSLLFFHGGGIVTAHSGWPLRHDDVPIIAQTGERVLSREQNRAYEAGRTGGGRSSTTIHVHLPNQTQAEIDRFARRLSKSLHRQENRRVA